MILAVEDQLSEMVMKRILLEVRGDLPACVTLGRKGKNYLRTHMRSLNQTASVQPVLVLIDSDDPESCPVEIISAWVDNPQPHLIFRIAVSEVEAWLLADREQLASFISVPENRFSFNPEALHNPKEALVNLARGSRQSAVRDALVPRPGGTAKVGPGYNALLSEFVDQEWDPIRAARLSGSLRRAINSLSRI